MGRALVLIQTHVLPTKQNPPPPNGAELRAEPLAQAPQNRRRLFGGFFVFAHGVGTCRAQRKPLGERGFLYAYQCGGKCGKRCRKSRIESGKRRLKSVSRHKWFSFRFRANLLVATKKEVRIGKENTQNHHTR